VLNEILDERVVSSRGRRNPRKLKYVRGKYPLRPAFDPLPKRILPDYAYHVRLK
jgi:hypothetical protein